MIQLRRATSEDFEDLLVLFRHLWPNPPIVPEQMRAVYLKVINTPYRHYFCAVEEDRIVGLGSVTFKDNLWQQGQIAYVEELVVLEEMRGRGIGSRILDHLIALARERGCRRIELDSALHRKEAHRFYEQRGFESRARLYSLAL